MNDTDALGADAAVPPAIQPIANLVVRNDNGEILLARYGPEAESDDSSDQRWWLPAHELEPYQHPDDAVDHAIAEIGGVVVSTKSLARVQSFRGRRGWHISFDYLVEVVGTPGPGSVPAAFHPTDDLPATAHGNWERETIEAVLAES